MFVRRVTTLAVAVSVLAACSLGDKQAMADAIAEAAGAAATSSPVRGDLTIALEIDETNLEELEGAQRDQFAAALGELGSTQDPTRTVYGVTADLRSGRATVRSGEEPVATFVGDEIFVRRQNARSTEKRVWATIDLAGLSADERPLLTRDLRPADVLRTIAVAINPAHLVDLAAGSLAGSTERVGAASLDGVAVTHYRSRVSLDQAVDALDLTDEQTEARLRLHELLRTRREVMPAEFWIDSDGRLRQLRVELRQRTTRRRANSIVVTLHLTELGVGDQVAPPPEDRTVVYETFARLVRSGYPEAAE